jgi:lysophospholipase L1-like esterase
MTGPDPGAGRRAGRRAGWVVPLAAAVLLLGVAPVGAVPIPDPGAAPVYLALGDSLSLGVQPDGGGRSRPTDEGYADALAAAGGVLLPGLELVKLGCPGETTGSMLAGGRCPYRSGSQLGEATAFLAAHRASTVLVTLDIGANDLLGCADRGTGAIDMACVTAAFQATAANLPRILADLRAAAGPGVPIVGMNYYDPFLAAWRQGPDGQALARASVEILVRYNQALGAAYQAAGVPVADVQAAFATTDFATTVAPPDLGPVPLNVALVCRWTWMCAAPPVGPNIHPRPAGYRVMAAAFVVALLGADLRRRPALAASLRSGLAAAPPRRAR